MTRPAMVRAVSEFLRRNAFKIGIVLFVFFMVVKKDFSFSINLSAPEPTSEEPIQRKGSAAPSEVKAEKSREILTQKSEATAQRSLFDFDFPRIGGGTNSMAPRAELASISTETRDAYITRFAHVAENEQAKFGIPASITLGCALLQSQAGARDMARQGHNHFALPCTDDWQATSGTYQGSCYRHYENAWTSFRDHSYYLTTGKFTPLTKNDPKDYKAWARDLERYGYSEERNFEDRLIQLIEQLKLHQYDQ